MLQTLKKKKNEKLFYGVNSGNYGFLMNKFSSKNIKKILIELKCFNFTFRNDCKNNKNNTKKFIAINEVSILETK